MLKLAIYWIINVFTIYLASQFWRRGGDGYPRWRNPGVPILLAVSKLISFSLFFPNAINYLFLLYIPALWAMLQAVSYGLNAPPHKFWVWIFGKGADGNYRPVEIITRATCGFFWSLPAVVFLINNIDSYGYFIFYSIFLTIANGLIGGLVRDVEYSERGVGACVATSILI
jgi:hypothetical protein